MIPIFLTLPEIVAIHDRVLAITGGEEGILKQNELESAVGAVQATYGGDYLNAFPFEMAAAQCISLAKNHAFVDGNKRTASAVLYVFLACNGHELNVTPKRLATIIQDVSTGEIKKAALTTLLRENSRKR